LKTPAALTERERRMLEMLARGATAHEIGRALGYTFGSTRVYLHFLYRKIGVKDKANAAVWFHDRLALAPAEVPAGSPRHRLPQRGETCGDIALRTDLRTALGAMAALLGPYGRPWEVAARLKGGEPSASEEARRTGARTLWEAFLRGEPVRPRGSMQAGGRQGGPSPSESVLLALLLSLAGDSAAARRVASRLSRARGPGRRISASELALMEEFGSALVESGAEALGRLHAIATGPVPSPAIRHASLVALFHVHRHRDDLDRARDAANALWTDAEQVRRQLQAMGERGLGDEVQVPEPPAPVRPERRPVRAPKARVA
jgi:DNA-binding CsgD family transcriptional regulator